MTDQRSYRSDHAIPEEDVIPPTFFDPRAALRRPELTSRYRDTTSGATGAAPVGAHPRGPRDHHPGGRDLPESSTAR
jgi:hypothetical protein